MKKHIRIIICLFICTSIFLSLCMIGHNADHDCVGENCQICHDLALQRELLRSVLLCVQLGCLVASAPRLLCFMNRFSATESSSLNLVANKVKLTA